MRSNVDTSIGPSLSQDYQATLAAKGFSSDDPCMIVSEQINTGRGVVTFSKPLIWLSRHEANIAHSWFSVSCCSAI
eukprot:m.45731 g.45731  ORF g.45731 m.45731 type:complete len:76 (+) comp33626_c0_seq8:671-898(+)